MASNGLDSKINDLLQQAKWDELREVLEGERAREPENHWVLTQLGVTYYEQSRYEDALDLFLASLDIVSDCPLTLWNLAGTLDALGSHAQARLTYDWLLQCRKTPDDDPCWESQEWTDALKSDCVYRLGVCSRHLGEEEDAERWFRRYVDLLLAGPHGTYSIQDVAAELRKLRASQEAPAVTELEKIVRSTRRKPGIGLAKGRRNEPPKFTRQDLLPARRVATKK